MEPQVRTEPSDGLDPAVIKKFKLALLAIAVVGVVVLVGFLGREL